MDARRTALLPERGPPFLRDVAPNTRLVSCSRRHHPAGHPGAGDDSSRMITSLRPRWMTDSGLFLRSGRGSEADLTLVIHQLIPFLLIVIRAYRFPPVSGPALGLAGDGKRVTPVLLADADARNHEPLIVGEL